MVDVCIITGFGFNADYEAQNAFQVAGAENVKRVHLNQFIHQKDSLENYQIMMIPGGFSFGDDLGSGRVVANKFRYNLRSQLLQFINADKLILGICNGFQTLVKMGLLPALNNQYFEQTVSLIGNASGQFEDRWVSLSPKRSPCIWTENYISSLDVPVRHGEGNFIVKNKEILRQLWDKTLIPFIYDPNAYPNNPNGATDGIAGICNESGHIFGMMPHPECHIMPYTHPQWLRGNHPQENGLRIFQNAVNYIRRRF